MFVKIADALKSAFGRKEAVPEQHPSPEVLGLRMGGAFEIDPLLLKLIESDLIIEGPAPTQLISAVGVVDIDQNTRLVRYYTDDESYIQILQEGEGDDGVKEVSLWYFYDSKPVDSDEQWKLLLNKHIVVENDIYDLDGTEFSKLWDNTKPVAMTEKTYHKGGLVTVTDQFVMLYQRQISDSRTEELMIAGEEKVVGRDLDRLVARNTGIQLKQTDFKVVA